MPRAEAGGQQEAADVNPLKPKTSIILIYTALFNTKPARDYGSLGQLVKRVRSYDPTLSQFLGSPLVQGSVKLLTLRPHRTEHRFIDEAGLGIQGIGRSESGLDSLIKDLVTGTEPVSCVPLTSSSKTP